MYDLEGKERISEGQNGVCKFLFETEISDPQIWDVGGISDNWFSNDRVYS